MTDNRELRDLPGGDDGPEFSIPCPGCRVLVVHRCEETTAPKPPSGEEMVEVPLKRIQQMRDRIAVLESDLAKEASEYDDAVAALRGRIAELMEQLAAKEADDV